MICRRLPVPTRLYLRRDCATRGGRSARTLLRAAWQRAFGKQPEPVFIASSSPRQTEAA